MKPWMLVVGTALVIAIVTGAVFELATHGRPSGCTVGDSLLRARMLDAAASAYDRDGCRKGAENVRRSRRTASHAFTRAQLYLDARAAALDTAKDPQNPPKAVRQRAARADALARSSLVAGLAIDPFNDAQARRLNESIGRIGAAQGPKRAARACRRGERMVAAGLLDAAQATVAQATLRSPRACHKARTALAGRRAAAAALALQAASERAAGDDDAARGHDAEALRSDASNAAARTALAAAAADRDTTLDDVAQQMTAVPAWLKKSWPGLLVALIGALVLAAVAFRLTRYLAWRSQHVRTLLAPEGNETALGRRLARLQVRVTEFTGGDAATFGGADMSALVSAALKEPGIRGFPFDRMPATASDVPSFSGLGSVLGELPYGRVATAVLNLVAPLFAARSVTLDGRLLPAQDGSVVIGLSITAGRRVTCSRILREELVDPAPGGELPDRWRRLVVPAAAWARHEIRPLAGKDSSPQREGAWRGAALADAGRAWFEAGDLLRAATCYARALEGDPELLPVLNNLAVTEIRLLHPELAAIRLDDLLDQLDALGTNADLKWPGLRESAMYYLALAHVSAGSKAPAREPLELTHELALTVLDQLIEAGANGKQGQAERGERLRDAALPSLMLYAGVVVLTDDAQARAAVAAVKHDATTPAGSAVDVADLRTEFDTQPQVTHIVEGYVRREPSASARTHYNVACFYSRLSERADALRLGASKVADCLALARCELRLGLADTALVAWAQLDPALAALRTANPDGWSALIAASTPASHSATAASLPVASIVSRRDEMLRAYEDWLRHPEPSDVTDVRTRSDGVCEITTTSKGLLLVRVHTNADRTVHSDVVRQTLALTPAGGANAARDLLVPAGADVSVAAVSLAREGGVRILSVAGHGTVTDIVTPATS